MTRRQTLSGTVLLGFVAITVWGVVAADAPNQQIAQETEKPSPDEETEKKDLYHFMRLKLEASGQILEGLATEDFDLIKSGAKKLNEMSTAEKWRVSNDALYRNFSGDFQRVTKDLVTAAEEENLDRSALKWMVATMSCIECHRYTRSIMIASLNSGQESQP